MNEQFEDLKRQMSSMNYMDWMGIPESQNYSYRRKKREEKYTPIPDSIIDSARKSDLHTTTVKEGSETMNNYCSLGKARNSVLSYNLEKATQNTYKHKSVDKTGYMTMLDEKRVASLTDIADMKKARLLHESIIKTNPKHAAGWLGASRLEELDGQL